MRSIPFRVIFIAGLGEKDFPAADRKNHLDLRQARRRAGDVSPREQDNYMFLETLLSAREKLYLSYVSRNALTGDRLEPSSVILELQHMLEKGYVPKDVLERKLEERRYPLRRYDDPRTEPPRRPRRKKPEPAPWEGASEPSSENQARPPTSPTLKKSFPTPHGPPSERLSPSARRRSRQRRPDGNRARPITVPLDAISKFLECPLQGSASFLLRMRDDEEEDILALEDEAFESSSLYRTVLLREVFHQALASGKSGLTPKALAAAYDEMATYYELRGSLPTGVFAATERESHLDILNQWTRAFLEMTSGKVPRPKVLRFGGAAEHADAVDKIHAPVALEHRRPERERHQTRRVGITGTTQQVLDSPAGSLTMSPDESATKTT